MCSQILMFAHAEVSNRHYDSPEFQESCPLPRDIENKEGIFTSPSKNTGTGWVGVVINGARDNVIRFEKGIFVLTKQGVDNEGFINGCVYSTSGGKYLSMRLDLGRNYKQVMLVGKSVTWQLSRDFYSPAILECTDRFRDACSFSLK